MVQDLGVRVWGLGYRGGFGGQDAGVGLGVRVWG